MISNPVGSQYTAADAHLKAGEIEKARELLPLMLPSDRIVMGRKIAEKEAKAKA